VSTGDHVDLPTRRIRELVARQRRLRRRRAKADDNPVHVARLDAAIGRHADEIAHRRDHLAIVTSTGTWQPWTHRHFRIGDFARIGGAWYPVLHAGPTTLTIPPLARLGDRSHTRPGRDRETHHVAYLSVYGRRRAGRVLHTPSPDDATCSCRITIPTFNPEFVPERDGGPCIKPPVARLTVRHDGTACDCNGLCLTPHPGGTGLRQPWIEVVLFCTGHAYEYQAALAASAPSPATTFEELP
jgi:hypothetical protein